MSTPQGRAKKRATIAHSLIVRARGKCENCGDREYAHLQCAHIISRRYSATRTDLANAFCLCAGCHMRFTEWPLEFSEFVLEKIGEDGYLLLVTRAASRSKVDWVEECARLRPLLAAVNA